MASRVFSVRNFVHALAVKAMKDSLWNRHPSMSLMRQALKRSNPKIVTLFLYCLGDAVIADIWFNSMPVIWLASQELFKSDILFVVPRYPPIDFLCVLDERFPVLIHAQGGIYAPFP